MLQQLLAEAGILENILGASETQIARIPQKGMLRLLAGIEKVLDVAAGERDGIIGALLNNGKEAFA